MELPTRAFTIVAATTDSDLNIIRTLFAAYATTLGISLAFQNFSYELASLPGQYSPPGGALYLAISNATGSAIGCVAFRALNLKLPTATGYASGEGRRIVEMKRLYCTPEARGFGVGSALVDAVLEGARFLGYEECLLDTLPEMGSARGIYEKKGFVEVESYYDTPLVGTVFMRKQLV